MAAEAPTSSPAPASYPVLPQYPELIFAAIEAIDSKNGANKTMISKQIEATYGSLPAAHSTLLSHHLNKMRASGQLVVVKNNYVKPDPDAPPRRGRGRPRKPREPLPEGAVVSPARPRGRPPKSQDPLSVSSPKKASPSVSGRKRGRPRKPGKETAGESAASPPSGEKRGRGRPPKAKTPVAAPVGA